MDSVKKSDALSMTQVDECQGVVDVTYPIEVKYCGHCSMPIEYCEFYTEYDKCKEWLAKNYPRDYEKRMLREAEEDANAAACGMDSEKKSQKRGGKGMLRVKKDDDDDTVPKRILLSCTMRGKNKRVTLVAGMAAFKIDLRAAAKYFGTKFACGSSVSGDKEIVIQGDVKDELLKVIPDKWPEVPRDAIGDCGESKK